MGSPPGSRAPILRKHPGMRSRYAAKSSPPILTKPNGTTAASPSTAPAARRAQAAGPGGFTSGGGPSSIVTSPRSRCRAAVACAMWRTSSTNRRRVSGSVARTVPVSVARSGITLGATDPDTRRRLVEEVRHIAHATAALHRLRGEVTIELGPPPLVNPPGPAAWARRAAVAVLGDAAVVPLGFVNMGGEDFAAYLERLPGCFLRIGAREPGGEPIPAHSPRFYAAEESIFVGAAVLAEAARIASDAA